MNNDRVSELYYGQIFTEEGQQICRDRIHWMCGQVRGETVLDIGCSQGITSILLAREGRSVVGVDVEEPAIDYARLMLAKETEAVRSRIEFVLGDIYDVDLDGAKFDTVVMGEILEHHTNPRQLLERGMTFVAPGGTIVLATPFGYHPHDDHKFTFYLSDFAETIKGLCKPTDLTLVDGYIRFAGRRMDDESVDAISLDATTLLEMSEEAFLRKERNAYAVSSERLRRLRKLTDQEGRRGKRLAALESQFKRVSAELQQKIGELNSAVRKWEKSQETIEELKAQRVQLKTQLAKSRHLPPILPPPENAGPAVRGLSMLFGSVQHEIHLGRAFRKPHTTLAKTAIRVQKALRGQMSFKRPGVIPPPAKEQPAVSGHKEAARTFSAYRPQFAPPSRGVTMATILDTFSESCFRYEANLVPLSVEDWKEQMIRESPALLLCESAWQGNGGQWRYTMSQYGKRADNPLRELLAWCGANGIPRVFWNKEDPANFDTFKDVAADFDVVFTTDADCIPRYRELLGHDRVYALPFAAQPVIHNPIQTNVPREGVCFAGSWRADKYPERVADSEMLLGPAMEFGLDIYDRHANSKDAEKFAFPEPFRSAVRGSLDYDAMLSAYRAYKVFLNVNSVQESPTMFARRVFELMACGTPVISGESVGIRRMLGSLVKSPTTSEEARAHLQSLLADDDYRNRYAHAGYREVFARHTYSERVAQILEAVGIENSVAEPPLVTVLAATNRPEQLQNLLGNVRRQIHPRIELILLLNSDGFQMADVERQLAQFPGATALRCPESFTLAECLNEGVDRASGAYVAKMDDDDYYGAHYLSDLLLATRYTDAGILGKRSYFCFLEGAEKLAIRFPGRAHCHTEFVCGATMLIKRDVLDELRFTPVVRGTDTIFMREARQRDIKIYSVDPYNYIHMRSAEAGSHTWQISDDEFLSKCRVVATKLDVPKVMI